MTDELEALRPVQVPAGPGRKVGWKLDGRALVRGGLERLRARGDLAYIVAAAIVNLANFVFFILAGHLLDPASYGAVSALLNVVSVVSIPLNAVQAAVVQAVVLHSASGDSPSIRRLASAFAVVGVGATLLLACLAPLAANFLALGSLVPVVILALWLGPSVASPVFDGLLIGSLRLRPVAVSLIAGAVVRVGALAVLGTVHPDVAGPVLATVLNATTTLGVVVVALWKSPQLHLRSPALRFPLKVVAPTLVALGGYSALVGVDTVLARHVLAPGVAGSYAAAVTAGRIPLFLPMAVTVITFPRFVASGGRGRAARRLLLLSLGTVLVAGLSAAGAMAAIPHLTVDVLFGSRYAEAPRLIGLLGSEGAMLGVLGLLTYFHLARRSVLAGAPCLALGVAVTTILVSRPGPQSLALLMLAVCTALALVMSAFALSGFASPADGGPPLGLRAAARAGINSGNRRNLTMERRLAFQCT